MEVPKSIFRKYDIRGLLAEVTPEIAEQVGRILAKKFQAKKMIIGRDMRATSNDLAAAAIRGMRVMGVDVVDIGMCTTCLFNFAVSEGEGIDGGIMITASHNPSEYNGMKAANKDGLPVSGEEIYEMIHEKLDDGDREGNYEEKDILNEYLEKCLNFVDLPDLSGVKLVVDYGNGMGTVTMRPLLEKLGVEFEELYPEPNADFPNHEANPAKEETLIDLIAQVKETGADFGVALDGDADRIGFVDEKGGIIPGDHAFALIAKEMLGGGEKKKFITSPNQSRIVKEVIQAGGGEFIDRPIGRTLIIHGMNDEKADFSAEVSSHFYFKEFHNLESTEAAFLFILAAWKKTGKSMSEYLAEFRKYHKHEQVNIDVEDPSKILSLLEQEFSATAESVNKLDGIRCNFADWWFLVRASNTEPIVRLTVEAESEDLMYKKVTELKEFIQNNK